MTELDENKNITIANNNMKKVTSSSVEGDNVFPSFESISKNKFKTSFTQTEVTTHTNNASTCTTTDAIEAEIKVHSVTVGIQTDLPQITIENVKNGAEKLNYWEGESRSMGENPNNNKEI